MGNAEIWGPTTPSVGRGSTWLLIEGARFPSLALEIYLDPLERNMTVGWAVTPTSETYVMDRLAWRTVPEVAPQTFFVVSYSHTEFAALDSLTPEYVCRGWADVRRFLSDNPPLVQLLLRAYPRLEDYFGLGCLVYLELLADPESPRDEELFASVVAGPTAAEALQKLQAFEREWWLKHLPLANHHLVFDVEVP